MIILLQIQNVSFDILVYYRHDTDTAVMLEKGENISLGNKQNRNYTQGSRDTY